MEKFIEIGDTYNPETGQGEGKKIINTDQIVHVTDWSKMPGKVRDGINSRIYLSTGIVLDTTDDFKKFKDLLINKK